MTGQTRGTYVDAAHVDGSEGSDNKPTHPPTPSRPDTPTPAKQGGWAIKNWDDLVLETAERFGGTFPHPETSAAIAAVHQRAPNAVQRAIDEVAADYDNGTINSPWGILRSRVQKITADVHTKATATNTREKAVARAEQWIRTAGIHYDRETEVIDELYGERGTLQAHPDTQDRILELWRQLRPLGEQVEHEHEAYMARYAAQDKPKTTSTIRPLAELKAIAATKGADRTRL